MKSGILFQELSHYIKYLPHIWTLISHYWLFMGVYFPLYLEGKLDNEQTEFEIDSQISAWKEEKAWWFDNPQGGICEVTHWQSITLPGDEK